MILSVLVWGMATAYAQPSDKRATGLFERDRFRISAVVCPFKNDIEYEPGTIECGLLQVPENREAERTRYIELHFVRLVANKEKAEDDATEEPTDSGGLAPGRRDDPIVYLTGGPGVGATTYVERLKDHGIRKHRDLYILEQRGIGTSGDFCPLYSRRRPELDNVETYLASLDAGIERRNLCADNARDRGVDLRGYNTIENARDVKALRLALGFKSWNVWGISYGSILGQAYIKEDPDGIRAVALDAIVPITTSTGASHMRTVHWYDRDLKKLDKACQADETCKTHYPNLGQRVRSAIKIVSDRPVIIEAKDVEKYPKGKAYFFQNIAGLLPFALLYEQKNYAALPAVIYAWADAIEKRDPTIFKVFLGNADFIEISQGMSDAIYCNDGFIHRVQAGMTQDFSEHPILASAMATSDTMTKSVQRCLDSDLPPRAAADFAPVQTDIPTLIIEGDMDPITPPPLAKAILSGFTNGTYIEFPFAGHGPSRSVKCAGDMLNKFFDAPKEKVDASCTEETKAPSFYVLYRSSIVPRIAAMAIEDRKSLATPAIWLAVTLLVLIVAFVSMTLTPLGWLIDGRDASMTFGARIAAWFSATMGVGTTAVLGAAAAQTYFQSEAIMLFGMVSWAWYGAAMGLLTGCLGLLTIGLTMRARRLRQVPIATSVGFLMTGGAAISLCAFLIAWDLSLF
ncbi:MAG: alpha/beta hydrolase [Myxococcota bacterium]